MRVAGLVKGNREVHEVEIEVVQAKFRKAIVQSGVHVLGPVLGVPELRCDEHIFAFQARDAAVECFLESLGDFLLIAIAVGDISGLIGGRVTLWLFGATNLDESLTL